jgi:hypothetical protein
VRGREEPVTPPPPLVSQCLALGPLRSPPVMSTSGGRRLSSDKRRRSRDSVVLVLCLVFTFAGRGADCKQSYSVVAPKVIRPNSNFFVAVSVDGTEGDLQVRHTALPIYVLKKRGGGGPMRRQLSGLMSLSCNHFMHTKL